MAILCQVRGSGYKGVTHNDVVVLWRKQYYVHGMTSGSTESKKVMFQLRRNDTKGPALFDHEVPPSNSFRLNHPIVAVVSQSVEACCLNYTESMCRHVMSRAADAPGHLTQETMINNESDDDVEGEGCVLFNGDDGRPGIKEADTPFAILQPILKELCGVMELNHKEEDLSRYSATMTAWIAEQKATAFGGTIRKGRAVSSAVPTNKRRKTHGTSHY
jgi:hypothetical protein